jgi:hypothetical protein
VEWFVKRGSISLGLSTLYRIYIKRKTLNEQEEDGKEAGGCGEKVPVEVKREVCTEEPRILCNIGKDIGLHPVCVTERATETYTVKKVTNQTLPVGE